MPLNGFLDTVTLTGDFEPSLVHKRVLDRIEAKILLKGTYFSSTFSHGLELIGIKHLYSRQAPGLDLVNSGKNIVVVTHTASGKSMMYNMPVLTSLSKLSSGHALYLFPLKALSQDQSQKLNNLLKATNLINSITTGVYDGDTPTTERAKLRKNRYVSQESWTVFSFIVATKFFFQQLFLD